MAAAPKEAASGAEVKAPATPHRKKHEKTLVVQTVKPGQPLGIQPPQDEILSLVRTALEYGHGEDAVRAVEKLVELKMRGEDRAAAREFAEALAAFQAECPPIPKNKAAKITSQEKGTQFSYRYAELPVIAKHIAPFLAKHGLSYSWNTKVTEGNGGAKLTVSCRLRHINGHSETSECELPIATRAGMSDQQKVAAARTFGERLSLIEVCGITTADPDLDGKDMIRSGVISAEQATDLQALYEEVKAKVDAAKLFAWLGVTSFAEVPSSRYSAVVRELEKRRGAR